MGLTCCGGETKAPGKKKDGVVINTSPAAPNETVEKGFKKETVGESKAPATVASKIADEQKGDTSEKAPPVPATRPDGRANLATTKGGSMALPEDSNGALDRMSRDDDNKEAREIAAFLDEEDLVMEEDFENPFYMKVDRAYKVGKKVEYPPQMTGNLSFMLHNNGEKGAVGDGIQVTFAYKSLAGRSDARGINSPDKPNQDSVAVVRDKSTPHRAIFGVFDGHGPFGEHASHFCRMEMLKMYNIANRQHPNDNPQQILGHTLRYLDRKFASTDHTTVPVDPIVSGTTAIVIMLDGDDIIAANVGDSRAILATRKSETDIEILPLSDDHKPERPDERKRIEESSAILMNEHEVRNRHRRGGASAASLNPNAPPPKTYICRHTNGEIVYGVLFTRSIGDVDAHKHLGVSSEPEFRKSKVAEDIDGQNEQVIILGSDGVWDMMDNEEAARIALGSLDPLTASEEIVEKCSLRWAESGEGRRDDITACVVGLGVKFGWNNTAGEQGKDGTRADRFGSYYGNL